MGKQKISLADLVRQQTEEEIKFIADNGISFGNLSPLIKVLRSDWDSYFMMFAQDAASRSSCLSRQNGAIIVKGKPARRGGAIVSTGYNGAGPGLRDCTDLGYCLRRKKKAEHIKGILGEFVPNMQKVIEAGAGATITDSVTAALEVEDQYQHAKIMEAIGQILGAGAAQLVNGIIEKTLEDQSQYLCKAYHAEHNAIMQAARYGIGLDGAAMYITLFPCDNCAKEIVTAGIKMLYYWNPLDDSNKHSREVKEAMKVMFKDKDVAFFEHTPSQEYQTAFRVYRRLPVSDKRDLEISLAS